MCCDVEVMFRMGLSLSDYMYGHVWKLLDETNRFFMNNTIWFFQELSGMEPKYVHTSHACLLKLLKACIIQLYICRN